MTKHTPGPWHHNYIPLASCFDVGTRGHTVCEVLGTDRVALANTRLIAAAPELLEALKAAQPFVEDQQAFNAICAAIAKATGDA